MLFVFFFISLSLQNNFYASNFAFSFQNFQQQIDFGGTLFSKEDIFVILRRCIHICSLTTENNWIYTDQELQNIKEIAARFCIAGDSTGIGEQNVPLWEQFMITDRYKKIVFFGGDLHSHLKEFLLMVTPYINDDFSFKDELKDHLFVTIGDYVDSGEYSIELLTIIALLKIKNGEQFIMQRGNHDTIAYNNKDNHAPEKQHDKKTISFKQNIKKQFGENTWHEFSPLWQQFYATMPIASWLGRQYKDNENEAVLWIAINHASGLPFDGEDANIVESFNFLAEQPRDNFFYKIFGTANNIILNKTAEDEIKVQGSVNQCTNKRDYGLSYFWTYYNLENEICKYLSNEEQKSAKNEFLQLPTDQKREYFEAIVQTLKRKIEKYNIITPTDMQNRAVLISNNKNKIFYTIGGHQHSSPYDITPMNYPNNIDMQEMEMLEKITQPLKNKKEAHKNYGWFIAPWIFNINEQRSGYSLILAPPFLEENATTESVKKYVKTLNLETGTFEDQLPSFGDDALKIYQ